MPNYPMIRRWKITGTWLLASVVASSLHACDAAANRVENPGAAVNAIALYGNEIYFDVYREGDRVGFHRVRFDESGPELVVRSDFQMQIDILFFTAFRYRYESEGRWRKGSLSALAVTVNDDGKPFAVDVVREGRRLKVENAEAAFTTETPLYPTNHWNAAVLNQDRVLNTLTGRINKVRIERKNRESVKTERGEIVATRYAYTGELETEVWYDDAGRWVKMRFKGRDGSTVDYVCRFCQGPNMNKAQK